MHTINRSAEHRFRLYCTSEEDIYVIELTSATLLIAGLLVAAVAFLAGWLTGQRGVTADDSREQELEETVTMLKHKHEQYQHSVNTHFAQTAELVGNLTQDYRKVYEHLSEGAATLCDQNQLPQTLAQAIEADQNRDLDPGQTQAPLDYAPKSSPDEPGMLNERYGLDTPAFKEQRH